MPTSSRRRRPSYRWARLGDSDLLQLRFRDLKLRLRSSRVWPDVEQLHALLARRGIAFKPHVWLSTEWFSPDGIPGIAVPFFAAHPRLSRLERRMRGQAEGGNRGSRRQILHHEAGHAVDTAFGLRRRPDWRAAFGKASRPYPRDYSARPASRRFVLHLGHWYAQSHPTEDFAETFAVWLQPKARWRRQYAGWPALEKLEYVDWLMGELAGRKPRNASRAVAASLTGNSRTLREHYRRNAGSDDLSERRYDAWLQRTFPPRPVRPDAEPASRFLHAIRAEIQRALARHTHAYLLDHVTDSLRRRARELDLIRVGAKREIRREAVALHERVIDDMLRRNHERYTL